MILRQITTARAALVVLMALIFTMASRTPADSDTWWHLRSGQHMLSSGLIYTDTFSFTAYGQPWINHSWGAQLVLTHIWQAASYTGLSLYTAGMATAGMALVYASSRGSVYLRAFVLVLAAAAASVFWSARPQMISFVFSALTLFLLHRYHQSQSRRLLWALPVMMLLWGNAHAGYAAGFILVGAFITGEAVQKWLRPDPEALSWAALRWLLVMTLLSALVLVINPYGPAILSVPFDTAGISALREFIQEWQSPDFHQRQYLPFIILLVVLIGSIWGSRERLRLAELLLITGTLLMALWAARNVSLFAIAAAPIITRHLDSILSQRGLRLQSPHSVSWRQGLLNGLLAGAVVLAVLARSLLITSAEAVSSAQAERLPVAAVDFLNAHDLPGPTFNSYNWGGYVMLFAPQYPVFIDGRSDLYGSELMRTYYDTATGRPGWQGTLDTYGVRLVLIERGSGLDGRLKQSAAWTLAYADDLAVIYTRR